MLTKSQKIKQQAPSRQKLDSAICEKVEMWFIGTPQYNFIIMLISLSLMTRYNISLAMQTLADMLAVGGSFSDGDGGA